ncbi:hypothetical protein CEP54_016269 [Fusarium duplospermum]|uniref:Uncharacterized protein n=1 Tax=Fusarium duplospermum TaxID=1325734 RepID=A0A428NG79_9HYPO|nr:hypothetical protein CEP54_016269 [Fusarium duplospermum]
MSPGLQPDSDAAYCCKPRVTRKYDQYSLESYLESKLAKWVDDPTCPAKERGVLDKRFIKPDSTEASIKVARQASAAEPSPWEVLEEVAYGFITVDDDANVFENVLGAQLTDRWTYVTSDNIEIVYRNSVTVRRMVQENRRAGIASLVCRLNDWNDFMGKGGTNKTLTCGPRDLPDYLKQEWDSPEDEMPIHDGLKARDHDENAFAAKLIPRAKGEGKKRAIVVSVPNNGPNVPNRWVVWSQPYWQGDVLAQRNGGHTFYLLEFDPEDCTSATIVRSPQRNGQTTQGKL